MQSFAKSVALSLIGLIVALCAAEVVLRALSSPTRIENSAFRAARLERPQQFFLPSPGMNTQDYARTLAARPNTFRIAVIGDSFSFGPKLQFDDTFSKRLERFLNLNAVASPYTQTEVINFGTPGFGTLQEAELVKEALSYQPDLIILQITLNDPQLRPLNLEPEDVQRKFGRLPLDVRSSWWLRNSVLLRFIAERLHNQSTVRNYIQYHHDLFSNPDSRASFESGIERIKALVDAHSKARLVAVLFPLFDFSLDASYPFLDLHRSISESMDARNIPFLDLFTRYRGIPIQRLQLMPGSDSHPNEIAHRIAAEQLLRWLVRQSLIPQELIPRRVLQQRDNIKEPVLAGPFDKSTRVGKGRSPRAIPQN